MSMKTMRRADMHPAAAPARPVPQIHPRLLRAFRFYAKLDLRRQFHAVRLAWEDRPDNLTGWPIIVCLSHPSWWDPMLALYLSARCFPTRDHYAPIDANALRKYSFFQKLGFFGIEPDALSGAGRFLLVGEAVLKDANRALWITAQGTFTDVRVRPIQLKRGIGHLVHRLDRCAVLPLALEYPFWTERKPEALARFGPPILVEEGRTQFPADWTASFAQALNVAQDRLAADACRREAAAFEALERGGVGINPIYDLWRFLRAKIRGEQFTPEHGERP